jgi:hypothetical protein
MTEFDETEREVEAEYNAKTRRKRCQCLFEMPGHCPGPDNCPMQEKDDEEEDGQ